ncbi:putative conserved secreted protein [Synechococcus sp. A18-25c]|nr:putative conserved secreted protein [Synechococcus sp. A18-25c]
MFGLLTGLVSPFRVEASPGLCTGPVCADDITRSAKNHWQLVLKLNDQLGHREKVVMNCRAGQLSPMSGPVDRAYATAIGRRACRLAGEG